MAAIIIGTWTCENGKERYARRVIACPSAQDSEDVARRNGGTLEDYHGSRSEAQFALDSAPTGKVYPI